MIHPWLSLRGGIVNTLSTDHSINNGYQLDKLWWLPCRDVVNLLGRDALVLRALQGNKLDLAITKTWMFTPGTPFAGDIRVSVGAVFETSPTVRATSDANPKWRTCFCSQTIQAVPPNEGTPMLGDETRPRLACFKC
jgi:hypothetical protein